LLRIEARHVDRIFHRLPVRYRSVIRVCAADQSSHRENRQSLSAQAPRFGAALDRFLHCNALGLTAVFHPGIAVFFRLDPFAAVMPAVRLHSMRRASEKPAKH